MARARAALASVLPGIKHGWIPIALALLAHVPGRRAFAANEAAHGRPWSQFFIAGLFGDLIYVGPVVLFLFVAWLAIQIVLARREAGKKATTFAAVMGGGLIIVTLTAAWMFSIGAIEAKLQRGIYPTFVETKEALGSSVFAVGMLPTLLLGRYFRTSLLALVLTSLVLVLFWKRSRLRVGTPAALAGFVIGALVPYFAACEVFNLDRVFFPRTGGSGETKSPIEIVLAGKLPWTEREAMTEGFRELFAARSYSRDEKRLGLEALGFPAEAVDPMIAFEGNAPCSSPHPLRRPLDRAPITSDALRDTRRGDALRDTRRGTRSDGDELLDDAEALSRALFEGRSEPITVWQIAMESFRADDVNALNENAPPELTPVMNRLYREHDKGFGFGHAFQGGLRTVQNVSALLCGVANFPFSVAVGRDMGHFPLRCLPDVLSDGGFESHVYYPSDISFENMLAFFRYHGMLSTQAADMPKHLPTGSWRAVSDRALYDQALQRASRERSELNFVLTLSGHSPFTRPTDMPAEAQAAADSACKKMKAPGVDADECERLGVMAYADYALGELLDKLEKSPLSRRSVVVISADHSTNEAFIWGGSVEARARAHVPYAVYLPKALRESAAHPELVAPLLDRLAQRAAKTLWSLTDSPTLVSALVSATPQMQRIPAEWRFHTFGGQATSAHFGLQGRPDARVWGTDASAFVFTVDSKGSVHDDEIRNATFADVSQFDSMNMLLRGPSAFLSSFTKGYLRRCERDVALRMKR